MSTLERTRAPRATPEGLQQAVRFALGEGAALAREGRSAVRSVIYAVTARAVLEAGVETPLSAGLLQALEEGERSETCESAAQVLEAGLRRFLSRLIARERAPLSLS